MPKKNYRFWNLLFNPKGRLSPKGLFGAIYTAIIPFLIFALISVSPIFLLKEGYTIVYILILSLIIYTPVAISGLMLGIKRCHDLGLSGWSLLFAPFSIIGMLILPSILAYSASEKEKNKYGKKTEVTFQYKWLDRFSAWSMETMNGRMTWVALGLLLNVLLLIFEESETKSIDFVVYMTMIISSYVFALRLPKVEKRIKPIMNALNYIGGTILVLLLLFFVFVMPKA